MTLSIQPGKFISVEGLEGAGKSTVLQVIQQWLAPRPVLLTREPGGTLFSETIRQWVLHPSMTQETILPETELLLMFAARAQHLKTHILPALAAGTWVISDRFIDASYAYQGAGRGIAQEAITWLDHWIVKTHYPDLTLLLDISPPLSHTRLLNRGKQKDRIEQEDKDFFERVRQAYLARAAADKARIKVIDVAQSLPEVAAEIVTILQAFVQGER